MAGVLLVEDDWVIARHLGLALEGQGHDVEIASTGRAGMDAVAPSTDLVLLDLGLPDIDGLEVCRRVRDAHPSILIVVLTARSDRLDIIEGLDAGADDYLVKPVDLLELLARVRAHLRRRSPTEAAPDVVSVGAMSVDFPARVVSIDGEEVALRTKEYDLLALLVRHAGQVVTRPRIMAAVWDSHWERSTKTLDMHVLALRRKLGGAAPSITTVRGVGYRLEDR